MKKCGGKKGFNSVSKPMDQGARKSDEQVRKHWGWGRALKSSKRQK